MMEAKEGASSKRHGIVLARDRAKGGDTVKLDWLSGHRPKPKLDKKARQAVEAHKRMFEDAKTEAE